MGEDVQVGLGESKGKDRYWGGSGGFWRQQEDMRASWTWPGALALCLLLLALSKLLHSKNSHYFPCFLWQICSNNWLHS